MRNSYKVVFAPDAISGYIGYRSWVSGHLKNIGRRLPENLHLVINLRVVASDQELHDYMCRELRLPAL
jgi:hypothetical protein